MTTSKSPAMLSIELLFQRLARSPFRQRFHLGPAEYRYCREKGIVTIRQHAEAFILARLAPAEPDNDGKQTPMRGHPVFIAQHATATCCRGCLNKWHGIPLHQPVTAAQQQWIGTVILHWIIQEMARPAPQEKKANAPKPAPDETSGQMTLW